MICVQKICTIVEKEAAMQEVNVKEARSNFSRLLEMVQDGQEIAVTRHGKKVARLVPTEDQGGALPSLKKFRNSLTISGEMLSNVVLNNRESERY